MNLTLRDDPSSVQYTSRSDPAFWVRMVKPIGTSLRVSNFEPGKLSAEQVSHAMTEIIGNHSEDILRRITFENLVPVHAYGETNKQRVAERFDLLSDVIRRWASMSGHEVLDARLDLKRGLFEAVFQLR